MPVFFFFFFFVKLKKNLKKKYNKNFGSFVVKQLYVNYFLLLLCCPYILHPTISISLCQCDWFYRALLILYFVFRVSQLFLWSLVIVAVAVSFA
jgi:hypothetical protein